MTDRKLSSGIDYYKFTMGQLLHEQHPEANILFALKNRGENLLSEYVQPEELQDRLDAIRERGFTAEEIAALAGIVAQDGNAQFTAEYLDYLSDMTLPKLTVELDERGDITITHDQPDMVRGDAETFWETVVMSELNELYFENYCKAQNIDLQQLYDEGDRRLSAKIETLRAHPDIKIIDFGTRRRFSLKWHEHVLGRLLTECPENILGTSNVWLAHTHGVKPIGTFAHELPMVYAAMADADGKNPMQGHTEMLEQWYRRYGEGLSVALTDTFGTDLFFADFDKEQAQNWRGLRHDSGDPIEFGERVIDFYCGHGIDPSTKTIVFSDGLDIDMIVKLHEQFSGRINVVFGWGTTLTNDLGVKPNNIVMKAVQVNGTSTVKLSDNVGKHTGPADVIAQYKQAKESWLYERAPAGA